MGPDSDANADNSSTSEDQFVNTSLCLSVSITPTGIEPTG